MNVKTDMRLEKKVSKSGNEYTVLVIKLTPTYEKTIFLDSAEIELLNMYLSSLKNN